MKAFILIIMIIIIIIMMAYTVTFLQSGSLPADIRVIRAFGIGQVARFPYVFSRSAVGSLKSPALG